MANESIVEFVDRHADKGPKAALELFLATPTVAAWVGNDPERRARIEQEFTRVWASRKSGTPVPAPGQEKPAPQPTKDTPAPSPARVTTQHVAPAEQPDAHQREAFMCPNCLEAAIYSEARSDRVVVACRSCGRDYPDLLRLIPVREVGPFEFMLGSGPEMAVRVTLLILAWIGYAVLLVMLG